MRGLQKGGRLARIRRRRRCWRRGGRAPEQDERRAKEHRRACSGNGGTEGRGGASRPAQRNSPTPTAESTDAEASPGLHAQAAVARRPSHRRQRIVAETADYLGMVQLVIRVRDRFARHPREVSEDAACTGPLARDGAPRRGLHPPGRPGWRGGAAGRRCLKAKRSQWTLRRRCAAAATEAATGRALRLRKQTVEPVFGQRKHAED